MTRRAAVPLLAVLALAGPASCNRGAQDPGTRIVASVGSKRITVAQLQAYLDANLVHDEGSDVAAPGDLNRVKSRLFDDFLDAELLLQEAERRGIKVSDAELRDYLGDEAASQAAKDTARRDLAVQKLRESIVRDEVRVTDAEVDAWLATRDAPAPEPRSGTLRTLRLASYPEASRVRQEILSKKLSFDEAEAAYGADAVPDVPQDSDLDALPDNISGAVRALHPGEVSAPLPFESSVLLFLLEPPADPAEAVRRRRDAARRMIALDRAQAVEARFLDELRGKAHIERHASELPFAYVAEGAAPRAK